MLPDRCMSSNPLGGQADLQIKAQSSSPAVQYTSTRTSELNLEKVLHASICKSQPSHNIQLRLKLRGRRLFPGLYWAYQCTEVNGIVFALLCEMISLLQLPRPDFYNTLVH